MFMFRSFYWLTDGEGCCSLSMQKLFKSNENTDNCYLVTTFLCAKWKTKNNRTARRHRARSAIPVNLQHANALELAPLDTADLFRLVPTLYGSLAI